MKFILNVLKSFGICFLLLAGTPVYATEVNTPRPDLNPEDRGTLSVHIYYGTNSIIENISEVEVGIIRTADLSSENYSAIYTPVKPFSQIKTDYESMKTEDSKEVAAKFQKIAEKNRSYVFQGMTDSEGIVRFKDLKPGMYLVFQLSTAKKNDRYTDIEPFLVSVPQLKDDKWNFNVTAEPKTGIDKVPPGGNRQPPNTGIETDTQYYRNTAVISLGFILILGLLIFRQKKQQSES